MKFNRLRWFLLPCLGIVALSGCKTTDLLLSGSDAEFQEFEQLFNQTMVGKDLKTLKQIWTFPNAFSQPLKTEDGANYWPIYDQCAYFAVERNGKITGLSKEYNQKVKKFGIKNLAGDKGYYDKPVYNTSRCMIPKAMLQNIVNGESVGQATRSKFEIFGVVMDKSTIKDFRVANKRCKITKTQNQVYDVSKSCLPFKAKEIIIRTNNDGTIGKISMILDLGNEHEKAYEDYKSVLSETYGPSIGWYTNGLNWWIDNADISFFMKKEPKRNMYAPQVTHYYFEVESETFIGGELDKKYQEDLQNKRDYVENLLEEVEDQQFRRDKIRDALK